MYVFGTVPPLRGPQCCYGLPTITHYSNPKVRLETHMTRVGDTCSRDETAITFKEGANNLEKTFLTFDLKKP